MPNKNTFSIPSVKRIISPYIGDGDGWIDPFANNNKYAEITNDINPEMPTDYHMDAIEFMKMFDDDSKDGVLLDPPYSFHQVVVSYAGYGERRLHQITPIFDEASRVVKPGGHVLSFGWNSNGCGMKRYFAILEIYLIAHGGSHNDTIITVERKTATQCKLFPANQPLEMDGQKDGHRSA